MGFQESSAWLCKGKQDDRQSDQGGRASGLPCRGGNRTYWSLTGKTDYFPLYEQAFREFSADALGEQSLIRSMASEALSPAASALTVTVPSPGLAEKLEQEKKDFLADKRLP